MSQCRSPALRRLAGNRATPRPFPSQPGKRRLAIWQTMGSPLMTQERERLL